MTGAPPRLLSPAERRRRGGNALLLALGLAVAALLPPERPVPVDLCAFRRLTELPCPTCGLTRSVCHAARGRWATSLGHHPAGLPLALGAAAWALWLGAEAVRGRPLAEERRRRLAAPLSLAGVLLSLGAWALRLSAR